MSSLIPLDAAFPSSGNSSCFGTAGYGLPNDIKVFETPNGRFEIKPLESGNIGYGLGRAIRMGFDFVYPKVVSLFQSVIEKLPQQSLLHVHGVSAASIPQQPEIKQLCSNVTGNYKTSFVQKIAVSDDCAYIVIANENLASLQIINITDPSRLTFIGYFPMESEPGDLAISENLAFMTVNNSLQIINVTHPSAPTFVGAYTTSFFEPLNVIVYNKSAYVVNNANDSEGFQIINITDPSNPDLVGVYNTPQQESIKDIVISENKAYLAVGEELWVISLTKDPTLVGICPINKRIFGIAISNNYMYAVGSSGLVCIDISIPPNPQVVKFYPIGLSWDITVSDNYAYVNQPYRITMFNVVDPLDVKEIGSYSEKEVHEYSSFESKNNTVYLGCVKYPPQSPSLKRVEFENCPPTRSSISSISRTTRTRSAIHWPTYPDVHFTTTNSKISSTTILEESTNVLTVGQWIGISSGLVVGAVCLFVSSGMATYWILKRRKKTTVVDHEDKFSLLANSD